MENEESIEENNKLEENDVELERKEKMTNGRRRKIKAPRKSGRTSKRTIIKAVRKVSRRRRR